jgi:hypothetical protein
MALPRPLLELMGRDGLGNGGRGCRSTNDNNGGEIGIKDKKRGHERGGGGTKGQ